MKIGKLNCGKRNNKNRIVAQTKKEKFLNHILPNLIYQNKTTKNY